MDKRNCEKLELNKILAQVADYAALDKAKTLLLETLPATDLAEVRQRLTLTNECDKLLYAYGIGKVEYFCDCTDQIVRASKGSALTCAELLNVCALLRSARCVYNDIAKCADGEITIIRGIAAQIYFDENLENDITDKIISDDSVSDSASSKLYDIRTRIKNLNERIRANLSEYVSGKNAEYLQDSIITIRNDRYVIPVKAEHKSHVRGFVHDRSKTGSTFFIEPERILEMNNELVALEIDEREEVEAILKALSVRIGAMSDTLLRDMELLAQIDSLLAKAEYGYSVKGIFPKVNDRGYINIVKGRHPLIAREKVVPVSLELGDKYDFLLLSGANTGGKTVTLKMSGLFCLMACCGLFIPAAEGSSVAVFDNVFCDVGDSQSIEESLSTFSSHIVNIIDICENATAKSLVLVDELGGGTNPDEGQALAKAVIKHLLECGAKGIVTTHFTPLKEFAYSESAIENASMEFDSRTLKPLYRIKIGLPGASNALAIARRLGMNPRILNAAECFLSEGARSYENIVRRAEESRVEADKKLAEAISVKNEWQEKLNKVNAQIDELNKEKEKINRSARVESRRIIADRTEQAEELVAGIEEIFKKQEISELDLIKARTYKNKLSDIAFNEEEEKKKVTDFAPATGSNLKVGQTVFVKPLESSGIILSVSEKKQEAEVQCSTMKMHVKFTDLSIPEQKTQQNKQQIKVKKSLPREMPVLEINVLGLTVPEAIYEVDNFIDRAVTDNLEEIKVIHGVGTGKLRSAIAEHLKKHKNVESFRLGKYGEGETGVTFIKLK